jgi:DNA-directed RNA polymerase subunit RPC12/RpoP
VKVRYACVSCKQLAFTFGQKWWAHSTNPAECPHCGATSAVPASSSNANFCFILFAAILVTVLSLEKGMVWLSISVWPICFAIYLWGWHVSKMWPVSKKYAQTQRRLSWGLVILYALLKPFQ